MQIIRWRIGDAADHKDDSRFDSYPDYTGRSSLKSVGGNIITVSQVEELVDAKEDGECTHLPHCIVVSSLIQKAP